MTNKHQVILSHFLLFLVNSFYGANYVIAKGIMPKHIQPNAFIFFRVLGALILFWFIFFFRREKIEKKDLKRLVLAGFFGVCFNQLLFFNGLMLTSPVNSSIIMTSTPILVLILSVFFLREKITLNKIIGVLLGSTGAILLILFNNKSDIHSSILGDSFILINAFSYGMYLIIVKPLMVKYKPITVITWVFTFGFCMICLYPATWSQLSNFSIINISTEVYLRIGYVIVFVTFLTYLFSIIALKFISPTISSSYIYFQPLLAIVFILLFTYLGLEDYTKSINLEKLFSVFFIFIGVYLISKSNNK